MRSLGFDNQKRIVSVAKRTVEANEVGFWLAPHTALLKHNWILGGYIYVPVVAKRFKQRNHKAQLDIGLVFQGTHTRYCSPEAINKSHVYCPNQMLCALGDSQTNAAPTSII